MSIELISEEAKKSGKPIVTATQKNPNTKIIGFVPIMSTKEKGDLIQCILSHLSFHAKENNRQFDYADTFLSLCFMDDKELLNIARLAGV